MFCDCFETGGRLNDLIFCFKSICELFIICDFQEIDLCDAENSKTGFEELKRSLNEIDLSEKLDVKLEQVAHDVVSLLDDALLSNVKVCISPGSLLLFCMVFLPCWWIFFLLSINFFLLLSASFTSGYESSWKKRFKWLWFCCKRQFACSYSFNEQYHYLSTVRWQ